MNGKFDSPLSFLTLIAFCGAVMLYFMAAPIAAAIALGLTIILAIANFVPAPYAARFNRNRIPFGHMSWKLEDFVRHWLVVGRSGCGKTLAAIKTLAISFYRSVPEAGGLVIDQKGDFARMFAGIMKGIGQDKKLFVLRCPPPDEYLKEPPFALNLIGDPSITYADYADLVVAVAVSQGQKTSNEFFKFQARDLVQDIFETLSLAKLPVTLVNAYKFLSRKEDESQVLAALMEQKNNYHEEYINLLDVQSEQRTEAQNAAITLANDRHENALRLLMRWETFRKGYEGQVQGIIGQAENYLRPYSVRGLERTFSEGLRDDTINLFSYWDEGRLVAPSIPQSYGASRGYIMAFFKVLFYTYGLRRFDRAEKGLPLGPPCILWNDEAQGNLLRSEEGLSDINSLDKLRAADCGCVFAMQCYTSAIPPLETEAKADVLFTNLNNQVIFSLNNEKGRKIAADNIGLDELPERSYTYEKGRRRSTQHTKRQKHILPPIFFRRMPKFKCVILHCEGKHHITTLPPLTDDGKGVEKWFLGAYIKSLLFSW